MKCTLKESIKVLINDLIVPLKALQLLVYIENRICTQEEIYIPCEIHGAKAFAFFNS